MHVIVDDVNFCFKVHVYQYSHIMLHCAAISVIENWFQGLPDIPILCYTVLQYLY